MSLMILRLGERHTPVARLTTDLTTDLNKLTKYLTTDLTKLTTCLTSDRRPEQWLLTGLCLEGKDLLSKPQRPDIAELSPLVLLDRNRMLSRLHGEEKFP